MTIRVNRSEYRLLPSAERRDLVGFWLAKAQAMFPGVRVLAAAQMYSDFHDVFQKTAVCNSRKTWYFFAPTGAGGSSHQARVLDDYNTCSAEYPRRLKSYIYVEGRPIAVVHSERASGSDNQLDSGCNDTGYCGTFWIHTDQLGTPILATDSSGVEKWRWENDPFGREKVIEFGVKEDGDPTPDDDPSSGGDANKYNTCCCDGCGNTGCNDEETTCGADCCINDAEQDVVWSKTYDGNSLASSTKVSNLRLHFSTFDVAPGSTRTGKDYVRLKRTDGTTMAELTGNLGPHWSAWAGEVTTPPAKITLEFVADNTQDGTRGIVVDKVEYTECATLDGSGNCATPTGRMVLNLRMPGQIWDSNAEASYNFHRWYRSEDGRYLVPDPIGLAGGEPGYFGYARSNPAGTPDPLGLGGPPVDGFRISCASRPWECSFRGRVSHEERSVASEIAGSVSRDLDILVPPTRIVPPTPSDTFIPPT